MEHLIDDAFLKRLANLRFILKGRRKGHLSGPHPSPRAGVSLEFADYRDYTRGDDFRYVDWNIYGRLDRLLVKSFVHEVDVPIYIFLDLSTSMSLGSPPKARYAARVAAALAYLGLRGLDRVGLLPFADRLLPPIPPRHGMKQMALILRALQDLSPSGNTSINEILNEFLARSRESGLVFLVSDFFSERGYQEGISRLVYRGNQVVAIQTLDPLEMNPAANGSTRITDSETLSHLDLNVGERTRAQYQKRLMAYVSALRRFLAVHRIPYFMAPTDLPLDILIHEQMRNGGVIK